MEDGTGEERRVPVLSFHSTIAMNGKVPQDEEKRDTSGSVRVGAAGRESTDCGCSASTYTVGCWV